MYFLREVNFFVTIPPLPGPRDGYETVEVNKIQADEANLRRVSARHILARLQEVVLARVLQVLEGRHLRPIRVLDESSVEPNPGLALRHAHLTADTET